MDLDGTLGLTVASQSMTIVSRAKRSMEQKGPCYHSILRPLHMWIISSCQSHWCHETMSIWPSLRQQVSTGLGSITNSRWQSSVHVIQTNLGSCQCTVQYVTWLSRLRGSEWQPRAQVLQPLVITQTWQSMTGRFLSGSTTGNGRSTKELHVYNLAPDLSAVWPGTRVTLCFSQELTPGPLPTSAHQHR